MRQYIDTLQDVQGNALVGASVLVQNYIGGANASIFSDNGLTPILTSTVTTGADGQFSFFAADGDYNLVMSKNLTVFKTQSPVTLFDGAAQLTYADTGAANVYAIANSTLEKALRAGLRVNIQAANTNTGASTFAYNGLAAKPIIYPGLTGSAIAAASLVANGIYNLEYDGTSWQLKSTASSGAPSATSAAETAAGVTPTNFGYAWGDVRRYGADPTGVTDSSAAFLTASSCNARIFDGYPGGGNYIFTSECLLVNYPLTISGQAKNSSVLAKGTRITLQTAAGVGAAALHYNTFATDVTIEHVAFQWQSQAALTQYGFRATNQFRASSIIDCSFFGSASPTCTAISLECPAGGGNYNGGVTIRDCYIADTIKGINLTGPNTTVKIIANELYASGLGGTGISGDGSCQGVSLIDNTLQNWTTGINITGGATRQISNYFEANTTSWTWGITSISNLSIGDLLTAGGVGGPGVTFLYNNTSANAVMGGGFGAYLDAGIYQIYRGIQTQGNTVAADGIYTTIAPTLAANGGGSLSAITTTTFRYTRKNGEMTVHFEVAATLTGAATTQITMGIPASLNAAAATLVACQTVSGGSTNFGLAYVTNSGPTINIGLGASGGGTWTAGAIQFNGQITFPIIS